MRQSICFLIIFCVAQILFGMDDNELKELGSMLHYPVVRAGSSRQDNQKKVHKEDDSISSLIGYAKKHHILVWRDTQDDEILEEYFKRELKELRDTKQEAFCSLVSNLPSQNERTSVVLSIALLRLSIRANQRLTEECVNDVDTFKKKIRDIKKKLKKSERLCVDREHEIVTRDKKLKTTQELLDQYKKDLLRVRTVHDELLLQYNRTVATHNDLIKEKMRRDDRCHFFSCYVGFFRRNTEDVDPNLLLNFIEQQEVEELRPLSSDSGRNSD